jgi:DNA (cytosine-5)-methyltransferase 1
MQEAAHQLTLLGKNLSEEYTVRGQALHRTLTIGDLQRKSAMIVKGEIQPGWAGWWSSFLRGGQQTSLFGSNQVFNIIDLFSSAGGLSLGVREATKALGLNLRTLGAVDLDGDALATYAANFDVSQTVEASVKSLVDYRIEDEGGHSSFAYKPETVGKFSSLNEVDLIVGGPPCQGHSSLNNYSRGNDVRNELYLTMPAMAVATNAKCVIIENVPRVVHDYGQVVRTAQTLFENSGYYVSSGVLTATDFGWPQTRSRHFMIASRIRQPLDLDFVTNSLRTPTQNLKWLIGDIEDLPAQSELLIDAIPKTSEINTKRINWLFDNDQYELADTERPICHQDGHTYPSVYGRLSYEKCSPTITSGFQSPGRGRYVHPTRRRVLTVREAARIQGFPDNYRYLDKSGNAASRILLQKWIGDAVPSVLGYVAGLIALETMI